MSAVGPRNGVEPPQWTRGVMGGDTLEDDEASVKLGNEHW